MNNFIYFLTTDDRTAIQNGIRTFFGFLIKFIYKLFSGAIDLMYNLATFNYQMDDLIEQISNGIFNILIIFMLFKLSFSILTYIVNPDLASDGNKGFQNIIKRIMISIILLISINPIFKTLESVQNAIIDDDIITSIFTDPNTQNTIKIKDDNFDLELRGLQMSPNCPSNKMIYTFSKGDRVALLLFRPFFQPYDETDIDDNSAWNMVFGADADEHKNTTTYYCGVSDDEIENNTFIVDSETGFTRDALKRQIDGPNSVEGFMNRYYINISTDEVTSKDAGNGKGTGSDYYFEFNYIFAAVAGIIGLLIIISFCFDVVIRSFTLLFLQMVAPIPIISYVSPQGKSSEMLSVWGKKVITTWVSLFIRIISLTLAITLIDKACANINSHGYNNVTLMMELFIILGILMFAKKLPQLIEELFPGLKMDPLKLNPFKRVREDALGGNMIMNAADRTIGAVSGTAGGAVAGLKAGREIGRPGMGLFMGATSGLATGFSNKKMSFGSGMDATYKKLTGNEMNKLSLSNIILSKSKKGQALLDDVKTRIGKGYDDRNNLMTKLNISEHTSTQLASLLSSRGYDVTSFDNMRTDANNRIQNSQANLGALENRRAALDVAQQNSTNAFNVANGNYTAAEEEYNLVQGAYQNAETMYNNAVANHRRVKSEHDDIEKQIEDIQNQISKDTSLGSFKDKLYESVDRLQKQKANLERYMNAAEGTISARQRDLNDARTRVESARTNMNNLREVMVEAQNNMNTSVENYNNIVNEINNVNNEIASYNNDLASIDQYQQQNNYEVALRKEITDIEKSIDVQKHQKSQIEQMHGFDTSDSKSFSKSSEHIDNYNADRSMEEFIHDYNENNN